MNLDRIDRHLCAREYVNNPLRSAGAWRVVDAAVSFG
jgi:hypothetical protein